MNFCGLELTVWLVPIHTQATRAMHQFMRIITQLEAHMDAVAFGDFRSLQMQQALTILIAFFTFTLPRLHAMGPENIQLLNFAMHREPFAHFIICKSFMAISFISEREREKESSRHPLFQQEIT